MEVLFRWSVSLDRGDFALGRFGDHFVDGRVEHLGVEFGLELLVDGQRHALDLVGRDLFGTWCAACLVAC